MLPGSGVKLCVGRCGDVARDAEQGTEGVERIEPPVEAEGEFVVTGGVNPRIDGEACAGEDRGAAEAPGLFDGMAIQNDGLSVVSSG